MESSDSVTDNIPFFALKLSDRLYHMGRSGRRQGGTCGRDDNDLVQR